MNLCESLGTLQITKQSNTCYGECMQLNKREKKHFNEKYVNSVLEELQRPQL